MSSLTEWQAGPGWPPPTQTAIWGQVQPTQLVLSSSAVPAVLTVSSLLAIFSFPLPVLCTPDTTRPPGESSLPRGQTSHPPPPHWCCWAGRLPWWRRGSVNITVRQSRQLTSDLFSYLMKSSRDLVCILFDIYGLVFNTIQCNKL